MQQATVNLLSDMGAQPGVTPGRIGAGRPTGRHGSHGNDHVA